MELILNIIKKQYIGVKLQNNYVIKKIFGIQYQILLSIQNKHQLLQHLIKNIYLLLVDLKILSQLKIYIFYKKKIMMNIKYV